MNDYIKLIIFDIIIISLSFLFKKKYYFILCVNIFIDIYIDIYVDFKK